MFSFSLYTGTITDIISLNSNKKSEIFQPRSLIHLLSGAPETHRDPALSFNLLSTCSLVLTARHAQSRISIILWGDTIVFFIMAVFQFIKSGSKSLSR